MRAQGNEIIRDAAKALGLPWSDATTAYASLDANVQQLLGFANEAGQDLSRDYNWTHLQKRWEVAIQRDVTAYALPADWLRMIPMSLWGQPSTWQAGYGGPTASQWEELLNWNPGASLRLLFRIQGESLEFSSPPPEDSTVTLAYQSALWVGLPNAPLVREAFAVDADETPFDRRLMVTAVKVRYLEARGFDSVAARLDYERAFARATGADGTAPALRIGGSRWALPPTLRNLPPTGWGR